MEWKKLLVLETQVQREEEPEDFLKYPISNLEKDYQAIISSSAFRRLQDKTQVFPLDKTDFVRTRLTHSIEVSTIARQLGIMITKNDTTYLKDDFKNNGEIADEIPVILSCAGLLHDIGNPPFGHFGEVVIGEWFKSEFEKIDFKYKGRPVREILNEQMIRDLKNFEGNAQALRILSKVNYNEEGYDVNLSFGVLNTLIKYPTSSVECKIDDDDVKKHKLGYFYAEQETMDKICEVTGTKENSKYLRHPLVFLMEAADDIAYATADLEDALKKGMFTIDEFIEYFEKSVSELTNDNYKGYSQILIDDLKQRIKRNGKKLVSFQKWMELARKWLKYVVIYSFSRNYDDILKGQYKFDLFYNTNHQETIKILKGAMREFVYDTEEIVELELAAKKIISTLLDDFVYAVLYWEDEEEMNLLTKADKKCISILPENYKEDFLRAKTDDDAKNLYLKFLMVTDYISGMTDSFAKNLYQKLNGIF